MFVCQTLEANFIDLLFYKPVDFLKNRFKYLLQISPETISYTSSI